jgi:hypothetical protein
LKFRKQILTKIAGISIDPVHSGEVKPQLDTQNYGARTRTTDMAFVPFGYRWKEAQKSVIDTFRSLPSPIVLWAAFVLAILKAIQVAIAQTAPAVLIAEE